MRRVPDLAKDRKNVANFQEEFSDAGGFPKELVKRQMQYVIKDKLEELNNTPKTNRKT